MGWQLLTDDELRVALARRLRGDYWTARDHVETLIKYRRNDAHRAPVLIAALLGGA